jgi:hypothetical protein
MESGHLEHYKSNREPLTPERLRAYSGLSAATDEEAEGIIEALAVFTRVVLELHCKSEQKSIVLKPIKPETDAGQ